MIRQFELIKRRGTSPRLVVRIQRHLHDVSAEIKYYFSDGHYEFKFPSSFVAPIIADEVCKFVELVNSPHWLAEIQPNCEFVDDDEVLLF